MENKLEQLERHIKTYIIKQYKANSFEVMV